MRSEHFLGFTISSILGVVFEETIGLGYTFGLLCVFLALIIFLLSPASGDKKPSYFVSLVLFGCAIGIFSVDVSIMNRKAHALDSFIGSPVMISGVVTAEPDIREMNTNIVITTESVGDKTVVPVDVLVRAPMYPEIQYGDELTLSGKIQLPKNFAPADGGRAFDYRAYLAKDGIYYEMPFSKITIVSHDNGNWVLGKLLGFKRSLMNNIARAIPEPESSLAGGIVLGTKQSLGKEWMQKFRDAGLAHIVVLSGYNIAVVANVIARIATPLPFAVRLGSSAFGIILFAMMVGGGATVLRATLMALVVILARATGRESETLRVLVFVGWLMVMLNPAILLSDVSFQLSFMAALALVVLVPRIEKYFLFMKSSVMREILVTTIATQIFVAPILLYQMGNFSLVGLVANLFVLPTVPLAMLLVSLVAVIGGVPLLATIVVFPAQLLLSYILSVVNIGSRVTFANIHIASFDVAALIISYGIIFFVCMLLKPRQDFSPHKKLKEIEGERRKT